MSNKNEQESIRQLPHGGRVRGFIAVRQQMRREAEMRLRRRSIWFPVLVNTGLGRVANLALLCKAVKPEAVRAPNPISYQRIGRGRGLSALLHDHLYNPSRAISMERARKETLALTHSLIPLCKFLIHGPNAYTHKGTFPTLHLDLIPHLDPTPTSRSSLWTPIIGVHNILWIFRVRLWGWLRLKFPFHPLSY